MKRGKVVPNKILLFLLLAGLTAVLTIQIAGCTDRHGTTSADLPKLTVNPLGNTTAGRFVDLKAGGSLPDFPEKVMVYRVKRPAVTREQVLAQAQRLGITGEIKETPTDFRIGSQDGNYIVDRKTGSFTYTTKEFELQVYPLKTVLSDGEYEQLATNFLTEKGLLKENAVFRDVNRDNTYTSGDDTYEKAPFMIEARFGHKDLNGIRFNGTGPKISVYFGENGRIIGAASVWREIEPFREYPIITCEEALKLIKNGKGMVYGTVPNDRGTVKEARLIYLCDPLGYDQEFIIPYYQVSGTNGAGEPFLAYTRAIPDRFIY